MYNMSPYSLSRSFRDKPCRAVIYGRASTEHEAQVKALQNQMQWYDDVARFHPQWNVINRYIDQGITGTQVYKRDAFMQMMEDAVVDTLIQWRDGFMNIVYSQETDRQHFDIASKINLSCILTGFTLTDEETSNQDRYIAEFTSDSGGWYTVRVVDIGSEQEVGIDNELTRYYELEFDGNHAIWGIREDNSNVLVWEADGLSFTIYGNPNISELIKVAEGITVDSTLK